MANPCDHVDLGPAGELLPWCETGEHEDAAILAGWQADQPYTNGKAEYSLEDWKLSLSEYVKGFAAKEHEYNWTRADFRSAVLEDVLSIPKRKPDWTFLHPPKSLSATEVQEEIQAVIDHYLPAKVQDFTYESTGTDKPKMAVVDLYPNRHAVDAWDAYTESRADQRQYAVAGLIREGCTALLSALIGSGKTTLALNFARGWALGGEVLGRKCIQSRTLAVVSPKEYEAWIEAVGFWELKGWIYVVPSHSAHFSQPEQAAKWFDSEMKRIDARTFVLDTLFDFFGMPPNNAGDSNRIVMTEQTPLLDVVRERLYAGLVTGHAPKSEARAIEPREPEEAFAGHTAWAAQHRMRITIRRKSHGVNAIVSGRGAYGDEGITHETMLLFDEKTRLDSLGGLFSEHLGEVAMPSVLECLKQLDKPVALSVICREMDRGEKWVRPGIREGKKLGLVIVEGHGKATKYRAAQARSDKEEDFGYGEDKW